MCKDYWQYVDEDVVLQIQKAGEQLEIRAWGGGEDAFVYLDAESEDSLCNFLLSRRAARQAKGETDE